jgi:Xaa-Pro aminopeptidase
MRSLPVDVARHRQRRLAVMQAMLARGGGVAVQFTAQESRRNGDSEYPYRFDSRFWYLTGFAEPSSVLVLVAHSGRSEAWLFCRERDPERELWDGVSHGPEQAKAIYGFDATHPIEALEALLPTLLVDAPSLYYSFGEGPLLDANVQRWLAASRALIGKEHSAPAAMLDLKPLVDELRLVKDESELAAMRQAAGISGGAHARAMRQCRAGMREYELEAEVLYEFQRHGTQPAYVSVVAAGANACVLHHPAGDTALAGGELVLVDAGCEVQGYAADITRTFPVNGRFSGEQRAVYEIVLAAQIAAIDEVRPGALFTAPHDAATRVITQGLLDLQLIAGTLDGALESKAYRPFFMHSTGHWLGLDVHDVGEYRIAPVDGGKKQPRALVPGMVTTVEPGLYIRAGSAPDARFDGIGIRIEDDVAVTADGNEVLSAAVPKRIDEVESCVGQGQ